MASQRTATLATGSRNRFDVVAFLALFPILHVVFGVGEIFGSSDRDVPTGMRVAVLVGYIAIVVLVRWNRRRRRLAGAPSHLDQS